MNVYALFPFIATIAYILLLITTISSRPWQKRHTLFILFLIPAMSWSLTDIFLRGNFFPQYNFLLFEIIIILYSVMAVQFHCFLSSFYAPGQNRWLPFGYVSLAVIVTLVLLGYIAQGITTIDDRLYHEYGTGVIFIPLVLVTLATRNFYVFWKRLKILDNPVLYNQIVSLMFGLSFMVVFSFSTLLPWGREFPIIHFGNLINAFILSYATLRHELVDIKIVLRRSLAWIILAIIGITIYLLLLILFHIPLGFTLDLRAILLATMVAVLSAILVFRLRGLLFATVGKVFQGQSYNHRQNLSEFANKVHNIFSLEEQGGELLSLVTKAVGSKWACLLFPQTNGEDFTAQFAEPEVEDNPLLSLKLKEQNPIVEYLKREQKLLTRENLAILPEFLSLWEQEKTEIRLNEIELIMPLISRGRLISILMLGKKQSGRYSLEDFSLLEDIVNRVAVSIEKEYLREQLKEREEELSIINRSSAVITSSLDIQAIYDSFVEELKRVMDVSWTAISLIEENDLHLLALSSEIGSAWHVGERLPIKGTATEWVATHQKTLTEPDLSQESKFDTGKYHIRQGIRSIVYLPLIAQGRAIGSLIVASRHPNAYSPRQIALLEQLASQIAMPVENARLYAQAEERARIDELTGLLNRRSMDEMLDSEIGRHSRYGGMFSIIILDLDSFKAFNDNYGHLAGDKLLRQVGSIIKDSIRGADQAFRYGGDEFAVLLPQTPINASNQVAERIRKQVAAKVKSGDIPITVSLGLASWPVDGIGKIEIIETADAALYHAKRHGGNQSHVASGILLPFGDRLLSSADYQDSGDLNAIYTLAATVDARDHYNPNHSKIVSEYAVALGEALKLEPPEISKLQTCALLHDVGKVGINVEILNKQAKLTADEWEVIKLHPQLGATIVSHASQLTVCIAGILHHHERHDGTGYPKGLKGDKIPLEARILAIVDAFVAMTSNRPYAETLSQEEALAEIKRGAGTQFHPELVKVFVSVVENMPSPPSKKRSGR